MQELAIFLSLVVKWLNIEKKVFSILTIIENILALETSVYNEY